MEQAMNSDMREVFLRVANQLNLPFEVVWNTLFEAGVLDWYEKSVKYDEFREKRRVYVRKYRAKQKEG